MSTAHAQRQTVLVIETERLLLRPLGTSDLAGLVAMHSDPRVARFVPALGREAAVQRLDDYARQWAERGYGMLGMIERATKRFVGRVGLKYWPQFDETEVGWVLLPEVWGRGLATEAAQAVVDWGFAKFPFEYITALIRPDNDRSIAVAERIGMAPLRPDHLHDIPVVVYALRRP